MLYKPQKHDQMALAKSARLGSLLVRTQPNRHF